MIQELRAAVHDPEASQALCDRLMVEAEAWINRLGAPMQSGDERFGFKSGVYTTLLAILTAIQEED